MSIILIYRRDDERNNAAINYINNGLKSGYQCIYASVDAYDSKSSSSISNLSSKIDNYKENIESGDYKSLILSLIMNQHYMEIYLLLKNSRQNWKKLKVSVYPLFTKQYVFLISDVNIVENGNKCLEIVFSNTAEDHNNNDNDYDIIIVDTHLPDISGFEVERKIRDRLPYKRIILTTTYSLDNICNIIDSIGIKSQDVILKPFNFSELFSILKEPRMSYN